VWLKAVPPGLPILPDPPLPPTDENCTPIEAGRKSRIIFGSKMMKLPVTIIVTLHRLDEQND
jgi:hypothetical protein